MRSKRAKALDISQKVKRIVWERDRRCCILCGSSQAMPNAHYISRAKGGLGIEENVVTLCLTCHRELDQSVKRSHLLEKVRLYLEKHYPNFPNEKRFYRKT